MIEIVARTPAMLPDTWHVMDEVPDGGDYIAALDRQAASDVAAGAPVGSLWEARTYRRSMFTTLAGRTLTAAGLEPTELRPCQSHDPE